MLSLQIDGQTDEDRQMDSGKTICHDLSVWGHKKPIYTLRTVFTEFFDWEVFFISWLVMLGV